MVRVTPDIGIEAGILRLILQSSKPRGEEAVPPLVLACKGSIQRASPYCWIEAFLPQGHGFLIK